jgi:hypothetical protein
MHDLINDLFNLRSHWEWLIQPKTNREIILWSIRYLLVFCIVLFLMMVKLGPKHRVDKAFTYFWFSLGFLIFRLLYRRSGAGSAFELWGTLAWINLCIAITFVLASFVADRSIRRNIVSKG